MTEYIGILVCNSQKVLNHKLNDGKKSESAYCYWEMSRFPKRILDRVFPETLGAVSESAKAPGFGWYDEDDIDFPEGFEVRLYFAVKGQVLGYFLCKAMGQRNDKYELRFHSESWTPISLVKVYPCQGFRYFNEDST
jgi:hypothetical protein